MKKVFVYLFSLAITLTLSCGFCQKSNPIPKDDINVEIRSGDSLSKLGTEAYSYLEKYEKNNMGGRKVCYEIAADINGIRNSNHIVVGETITFYSLHTMGIKIRDLSPSQNYLAARIFNNEVEFLYGKTKGFFSQIMSEFSNQKIGFTITIKNISSEETDILIFKGDLFETKNPTFNPQNLAIGETVQISLSVGQTQTIELLGYCTNKDKSLPMNEPIRPTALYIEENICESQTTVWNYFDSLKTR